MRRRAAPSLADADPSAIGPELSSVTRRVRRDWFDRWLERLHTYWEGKTVPGRKRPPDPAWLAEVQAFLRPTFEKVIPLGLQLEYIQDQMSCHFQIVPSPIPE